MPPGRLADLREEAGTEQQAGPAAKNDLLRVEEVDQGTDSRAKVVGVLAEYLVRAGRSVRGADELRQRQFLVIGGHRPAVPLQDRGRAGVGLQAARWPAPAPAAAGGGGDVPEIGPA